MGAYGSISIIHSAITENTKVLLVKGCASNLCPVCYNASTMLNFLHSIPSNK